MPETFVIDRDGRISHKFIGPLTEKDIDETLMPLIQKLHQQNPRPTP